MNNLAEMIVENVSLEKALIAHKQDIMNNHSKEIAREIEKIMLDESGEGSPAYLLVEHIIDNTEFKKEK